MEIEFKKIPVGRAEDLTGQIFGHWKVLYRTENNSTGKPRWVCQCDCKNHTIRAVPAGRLKNGDSSSCGCARISTMIRKRDEAIRIRDENNNVIQKKCFMCQQWLPLEKFHLDCTIKDGHSRMCIECYKNYPVRIYNEYKQSAKKRNLNFELNYEEFLNLISQKCQYCGEKPKKYNGVDRVESLKGYTIDNCVPCCEYCNTMKLNYSLDFWLNHIEKIFKHMNGGENE